MHFSNIPAFFNPTAIATDLAWQLIDLFGLNSIPLLYLNFSCIITIAHNNTLNICVSGFIKNL